MACNSTDLTSLRIGDDTVERTDNFRYLGSVLDASGDIDRDIKARISAAWAKWREVTGVICDPKMPVKLKGQVYKTIIRPVLTYGSEAWPVLERHRQLLHVTEMNMLRWMYDPHLITLAQSGKVLLMMQGYTFHKGGGDRVAGGIRWRCSSGKKRCNAYVVLSEDDQTVLKANINHNDHERPSYVQMSDGTYVKI
ncbi:unnamed protein product [Parnassius apollo]|uniref:(apollo) hypothetical protein n=1 Tax=Parnassius apollo TaxID=110799 RepID=A0A8S3W0U8_PARAO|nr:unnamed protein product [Parnassius apollo]